MSPESNGPDKEQRPRGIRGGAEHAITRMMIIRAFIVLAVIVILAIALIARSHRAIR